MMIRKTTFLAAAVALTLGVATASAQSGDHNMMAMNDYKKRSGRMFPTWSEVLEVLRTLGYEKPS